jgi:predicted helicase
MQRAVAFAKDIAASKQLAKMFPKVVLAYQRVLDSSKESSHSAVSRTLSAGIVAAGLIRSVVADGSAADGSRHGAAFSRLST